MRFGGAGDEESEGEEVIPTKLSNKILREVRERAAVALFLW